MLTEDRKMASSSCRRRMERIQFSEKKILVTEREREAAQACLCDGTVLVQIEHFERKANLKCEGGRKRDVKTLLSS